MTKHLNKQHNIHNVGDEMNAELKIGIKVGVIIIIAMGVVLTVLYSEISEQKEYEETLILCGIVNKDCNIFTCQSLVAEQADRMQDAISFEIRRNSCLISMLEKHLSK